MTEVALRPVEPDDASFLLQLYAETRDAELAPVPWTDEQKRLFLEQQYLAQDTAYRQNYPDASLSVIMANSAPIGRLYVTRLGVDELRIIDIALLASHRNQGIGTALIRDVMTDADAEGLIVSLHVEQWNPALRLYERLGFVRASENEVYVRMERAPGRTASS